MALEATGQDCGEIIILDKKFCFKPQTAEQEIAAGGRKQ
jgi:hypothetical protein